ncbi:glycosyltransferase [Nitrospiraceae bacterium AH_259_D15_M11_P09]|nr:glycosyltransferase [Nitrospiraceae bacterium AH_259_D15_M11_P09]
MTVNSYRPAVSVIIPTYNQGDLLRESLQSVLDQTFEDWETIVVNNCSVDSTVAVVLAFGDPRIRLVNFRNHGIIGASRNEGIRQAKSDVIAFLDSDDLWYPDKLEKVMSFFRHQSGVDLVCHDERVLKKGVRERILRCGPYTRYEDLLFKGNCISTSATAVVRSKVLEVGGFSEDPRVVSAEDYDLWLRLSRAGCRFAYLHEVLGTFRLHDESFTSKIEQHCAHCLNAVEPHFAEWQPKTLHWQYVMRRRKAQMLRMAGHAFMRRREHRKARRFLRMALDEYPLSWKAWVLVFLNLANERISC